MSKGVGALSTYQLHCGKTISVGDSSIHWSFTSIFENWTMYSLRKNFVEERGLEFRCLEHTLYILVAWKRTENALHSCLSWRSMNNANNGMIWAKIYKINICKELYRLELNYCDNKMWFLFLVCLKRKKISIVRMTTQFYCNRFEFKLACFCVFYHGLHVFLVTVLRQNPK